MLCVDPNRLEIIDEACSTTNSTPTVITMITLMYRDFGISFLKDIYVHVLVFFFAIK